MSMQIRSIYLYNSDGDIREIRFRLGEVNIITGKSDTGKSAIISIIEYCLGQSDFEVPAGVIRDTVKWFAVLYQIDETQVFIAKPAPSTPSGKSQSQVYYEVGVNVSPPSLSHLEPNSTDEGVQDSLSKLIGISSNQSLTGKGKTPDPFEATIRHARHYLFQQNDVIASKNILFYKQFEDWAPRTIRSTLPYFLGAVHEERLYLESQLQEARRRTRSATRKLNEIEAITSDRLDKGRSLISEAQQVGLISREIELDSVEDIIRALQETQSWTPEDLSYVDNDLALNLNEEIEQFRQDLKQKSRQINTVEKYIRDAIGYSNEVTQQALRLETINIFEVENHDATVCPICQSKIETPPPTVLEITKSLSKLNSNLSTVKRENPKLQDYLNTLIREREDITQRIEERRLSLQALEKEEVIAVQIRDTNSRIARIVGRISFYLEHIELDNELAPLRLEVNKAEQVVENLENELDNVLVDDRQNSILSLVSHWMTEWSKELELRYSRDYHYRFDLNKLTVFADLPDQTLPMTGMGGGANILGCHLITLCSLHKYFISLKRPVPSFLVLDQPAQVFFLSAEIYKALEGHAEEIAIDDRKEIDRMFNFLFKVCEELSPYFQIIVLEHANLDSEKFHRALVEEPWGGDRALIPKTWISEE